MNSVNNKAIKQETYDFPRIIVIAIIHLGTLFAPFTFNWTAFSLTILLHWLTCGLGVTIGFHRLISHRSFKTFKWLEYMFATLGTLTLQGSPIDWVGIHRLHHQHSDTSQDPHNPSKGVWWSHMGWLVYAEPSQEKIRKLTSDLNDNSFYEFLHRSFVPLQLILMIFLYLWGGWSFVVWGGFVRLILSYHCIWLINSVAHRFGYCNYKDGGTAVNSWWVSILTYGEGWHNNHHAHPHSARHGLKWWEIDFNWLTIKTLRFLGLIWNVRTVKPLVNGELSNFS